jgi:hypothetical protein
MMVAKQTHFAIQLTKALAKDGMIEINAKDFRKPSL